MKKPRGREVRVLVFPFDRETGYQQPLYREVAAQGVVVRYLEIGTSSQTLNLLLIPLSLLWYRLHGFNIWHIHWTYTFSTSWSRRVPYGRRVMQHWFNVCLSTAHIFGFKVVWTAHNILPHDRVFHDDVAARLRLTRAADAVIAHQEVSSPKLEALGARNIHVIPAGSYTSEYQSGISRDDARQLLGLGPEDRVVVFVGNIVPYKQVDWLLEAAGRLPDDDMQLRVVVAGACLNDDMLAHLRRLATDAGPRVIAKFGFVPDDELQVYFACADVAALPFARITSSGSAILALSFGVPLLLPDLPELAYFPDSVAVRYAPHFEALVDALAQVATIESQVLLELSEGARKYVASLSWEQSGKTTAALYRELVDNNWPSALASGDETSNATASQPDILPNGMHIELMLSFVMIAYNEADRIVQSLRSIQEQEGLRDYEIIVVDDGSNDATCEVVKDLAVVDERILLLPLGTNSGRGAARAAGVCAARGRYIAMVDADILLPGDWWAKCQEAIVEYDVVSGTAVPDGDVVYLSDRLHLEPKLAEHATATTGSNAMFRREVFDRVHYDVDRRNGEDVALSHAMVSCGLRTFVVPGLMVRHHENKTILQALSWLFESGIGASYQLETYRKIRRPDQATVLLVGLVLNVLSPRRSSRRARVGLLLSVLLGVSASHVHTKFVFRRKYLIRYAAGVVTDALLIFSYVCGRVVGHGYTCRRTKH